MTEKKSAPQPLVDLDVSVSVVLAEKSASLEQVLELRPGTVLEFSRRHQSPLDLYINRSPVGRGHAVDIGERLGFEIEDREPLDSTSPGTLLS